MVIFNLSIRGVWLAVLLLTFGDAVSAAGGGGGSISAAGGRVHVIPEPVSVTEKPGSFYLRQGATLAVEGDSTAGIAGWLIGQVRDQAGVVLHEEKGSKGAIVVSV